MNTATAITIAALAALTPTVTCLIGIILQRRDYRGLKSEIKSIRTDIRNEASAMREDFRATCS